MILYELQVLQTSVSTLLIVLGQWCNTIWKQYDKFISKHEILEANKKKQ